MPKDEIICDRIEQYEQDSMTIYEYYMNGIIVFERVIDTITKIVLSENNFK